MQHTDALLRGLLHVLTNSPRSDAIARTLALGTLNALSPQTLTVHAVAGSSLELRSSLGLSADEQRFAARIPLDAPAPEAHVARSAAGISASAAELRRRFPVLAHHDPTAPGLVLSLPCLHEARAIGVLTLRCEDSLAEAPQDLLDGVCAALALWLLADAEFAPAPARTARLRVTDRQHQVLDGLRRGLTNSAVAGELGFAVGTIKADITALSALLGAAGREDLLRKAERAGF